MRNGESTQGGEFDDRLDAALKEHGQHDYVPWRGLE